MKISPRIISPAWTNPGKPSIQTGDLANQRQALNPHVALKNEWKFNHINL
jgi:hypothetical protein